MPRPPRRRLRSLCLECEAAARVLCARPVRLAPGCTTTIPRAASFSFASEPRAILVCPRVPYRINEGRVADFLVKELEGIDNTSSFFEGVYRLPPAHSLRLNSDGVTVLRYWHLRAEPELRLESDEAYAEGFRAVLATAVDSRLRGGSSVGSMLSGGMDSGAIVAVAARLKEAAKRDALPVFSATAP